MKQRCGNASFFICLHIYAAPGRSKNIKKHKLLLDFFKKVYYNKYRK